LGSRGLAGIVTGFGKGMLLSQIYKAQRMQQKNFSVRSFSSLDWHERAVGRTIASYAGGLLARHAIFLDGRLRDEPKDRLRKARQTTYVFTYSLCICFPFSRVFLNQRTIHQENPLSCHGTHWHNAQEILSLLCCTQRRHREREKQEKTKETTDWVREDPETSNTHQEFFILVVKNLILKLEVNY